MCMQQYLICTSHTSCCTAYCSCNNIKKSTQKKVLQGKVMMAKHLKKKKNVNFMRNNTRRRKRKKKVKINGRKKRRKKNSNKRSMNTVNMTLTHILATYMANV